ncbi:MAG: hypothetical protein ACLQUT_05345 [Thermoleophilia bacterium]
MSEWADRELLQRIGQAMLIGSKPPYETHPHPEIEYLAGEVKTLRAENATLRRQLNDAEDRLANIYALAAKCAFDKPEVTDA